MQRRAPGRTLLAGGSPFVVFAIEQKSATPHVLRGSFVRRRGPCVFDGRAASGGWRFCFLSTSSRVLPSQSHAKAGHWQLHQH